MFQLAYIRALLIPLLLSLPGYAQTYSLRATVTDIHKKPVPEAETTVREKNTGKITRSKKEAGHFIIEQLAPAYYYLTISCTGYEPYTDSVKIDSNTDLGTIVLLPVSHVLDEVSIVQKVIAMVQKDDTLEYNSGAFKVNPDADAADLIRKMPAIQINDKEITAQGERVVKVLVDGKPFFGTDPYAAVKNLPADMIDKVQVYNEKSDQERFTGFREGATSKTVNIITKPGKRKGIFGNVYGGYGNGLQPNNDGGEGLYGAGLSLNKFNGERRITLTAQFNNVSVQNFSTENVSSGGSGTGLSETKSGGVNYSDKWGKRADVSGSYFFGNVNNSMSKALQRTYVLSNDSGQVYVEQTPSSNINYSHRVNIRINYVIDSSNSILFTPGLNLNKSEGLTRRMGNTTESGTGLNQLADTNKNNNLSYTLNCSVLFRHKFHKPGRTFSLNIAAGNSANEGRVLHMAQSIYYNSTLQNDTLNQLAEQQQRGVTLTGNATYTEKMGKQGVLKTEYNVTWLPAYSTRSTYDYFYPDAAYTILNDQYSSTVDNNSTQHKAGVSYQLSKKSLEFSVGMNYQLARLRYDQTLPVAYTVKRDFSNVLPVVTFQYKFSKKGHLNATYNSATQTPNASQLQDVVNNTDPLHLYAGNPSLSQPVQHSLSVRYNTTGKKAGSNFSVTVAGGLTQDYITSGTYIAERDTALRQGIILARGSQLSRPVNTDGYRTVNSFINYGTPIELVKCRLNISINGGMTNVPSVINNQDNKQVNTNGGLGVSLGSNISERIDFIVSSNTTIVSNSNSINKQLNNTFINQQYRASLNLILWKGLVFSTALSMQSNSGISAGYNQRYMLWNMSIGKKLFRKQQGDIRLSGFDLLNENSNIQHTVTDYYIQDSRNNMLQRYFLLVFTYKLREFGK